MPRAYSTDLRERALAACEAGEGRPAELAGGGARGVPPVRDREGLPDRRADALRLAADRPRGGPPRAQAAPRGHEAGGRRGWPPWWRSGTTRRSPSTPTGWPNARA